jgi:hypothetical protein
MRGNRGGRAARGRAVGAGPRGDAPRLPREIMSKIAAAIGLSETGAVPGIAFEDSWTATIQGDYAVATVNRNSSLAACNAISPLVSWTVFPAEAFARLQGTTSTVVHLPTGQVVRRGLPHRHRLLASAFSADGSVTDSRGNAVPSVSSLTGSGHIVSARIELPGPIVFVWKHAGKIHFSTTKKIDGKMSRIGTSSVLAEMYGSCGGPPIGDLFPDSDDADGLGVCYVFRVVHRDFVGASRIEVGAGYTELHDIVSLGGETLLGSESPLIKWAAYQLGQIRTAETTRLIDEDHIAKMVDATCFESEGASGETVCTEHISATDAVMDLLADAADRERDAAEGDYSPFPRPTDFACVRPPRGNANASALAAVTNGLEPENEEYGVPSVVVVEALSYESATAVLADGFFCNGTRGNPFSPPEDELAAVRGTPNLNLGEPVIVRLYDETGTRVLQEFEYIPSGYFWRLAMLGENPNVSQRLAALHELVSSETHPNARLGAVVRAREVCFPSDAFSIYPANLEFFLPSGAYSTGAPLQHPMREIVLDYQTLLPSAPGAADASLFARATGLVVIPNCYLQSPPPYSFAQLFEWAARHYAIASPRHLQKAAYDEYLTFVRLQDYLQVMD